MKSTLLAFGLTLLAIPAAAQSQLPPDLQAAIRAQGPVLANTPETNHQLKIFHVNDPAPRNVAAQRDIAYGGHPLQKLDVFFFRAQGGRGGPAEGPAGAGAAAGPANAQPRPIVIFIHGGEMQGGDKHAVGGLDNVGAWLVNAGFVGVSMNYRLIPDAKYPTATEDIAMAIAWARKNAAQFGGDPNKIMLWGHSSGANLVADYVSHPAMHAPGPEIVAAAISSGARSFDLASYGTGGGAYYGDDKSTYAANSALPGLSKTKIPLFLNDAEFDPPNITAANDMAKKALCAANRCPETFVTLAVQNHLSELDTVGTSDHQLTDPLGAFFKKYSQ